MSPSERQLQYSTSSSSSMYSARYFTGVGRYQSYNRSENCCLSPVGLNQARRQFTPIQEHVYTWCEKYFLVVLEILIGKHATYNTTTAVTKWWGHVYDEHSTTVETDQLLVEAFSSFSDCRCFTCEREHLMLTGPNHFKSTGRDPFGVASGAIIWAMTVPFYWYRHFAA